MADRYIRVRDKQTRHQYDILIERFDPDVHEEVKKGTYAGTSSRPRRIKYNVKGDSPSTTKTSGEPSGDNKKKEE